jgi:hypothetical protein
MELGLYSQFVLTLIPWGPQKASQLASSPARLSLLWLSIPRHLAHLADLFLSPFLPPPPGTLPFQ